MALQNKSKHHKQPQFYLKGFVAKDEEHPNTPSIWVYRKGEQFPKRKGISNTAFTKNFYAFIEEDGSLNFNKYEDLLMRDFEQPANLVIEKIRKLEKIDEKSKIILFRYIASMVTRGNWWKNVTEKIYEIVEPDTNAGIDVVTTEIVKIAKAQNDERFSDTSKVREFFQKRIFEERNKRILGEYEKSSMIKYAERFARELLSTLTGQFLIAPTDMPFITSDHPVCYTSFENKNVQLAFPISSKICFLGTRGDSLSNKKWRSNIDGFWQIDHKTSESIRDFIVRKAVDEVYYSKKAEWLVKFINKRA